MARRTISLLAGLATVAGAGVTSASIASSTAISPGMSQCHVSAADPGTSGGNVGGWTGRYNGKPSGTCTSVGTFKSMLRRDIPMASDPIDFTQTKNGITQISIYASEKCSNFGRATYYTSANTDGGSTSADSAHVNKC